jgi:hypothetical protein
MAASAPAQDRPLRERRGVVERITFQNAEKRVHRGACGTGAP